MELKNTLSSQTILCFRRGVYDIPDFRSATGLYSEKGGKRGFAPEQMLSHSFFARYPEEFFEFYKSKMIYKDARPNSAHIALARLEDMGKLKAVITQNIDGLHQLAGSKEVLELHGSVHRNYCLDCGKFFSLDYILSSEGVPKCDACGGIVKPDVVLYEEKPEWIYWAGLQTIEKADMLIVAGTSLTVYFSGADKVL